MTLIWTKEYEEDVTCQHVTGEWNISSRMPHVWDIDFVPALEDGETRISLRNSLPTSLSDRSMEFDYTLAKLHGQRKIATAPTKEFATSLVERIINNDVGDGVVGELTKHGIFLEDQSSDWICHEIGRYTSHYKVFKIPVHPDGRDKPKGFLEGVIHPYHISIKYVGKRPTRWWTLLTAESGVTKQNGTLVRENYWPKSVTDIEAIVTKFALEELVGYSKKRTFR